MSGNILELNIDQPKHIEALKIHISTAPPPIQPNQHGGNWASFWSLSFSLSLASLNEEELKALDKELMPYIQPAAIKHIPAEMFKVSVFAPLISFHFVSRDMDGELSLEQSSSAFFVP